MGNHPAFVDQKPVVDQPSVSATDVSIYLLIYNSCMDLMGCLTLYDPLRHIIYRLCSVRAAQQGSLRLYQCHCVLPINLFNEKICSIWWFYIVALLPLTMTSLAIWCYRNCWATSRVDFVEHYVLPSINSEEDECLRLGCRSFTLDYLGCDGVFVLRLVEINHGSTTLRTIVQELYKRSGYLQASSNPEANPTVAVPSIAAVIPPVKTVFPYSSSIAVQPPCSSTTSTIERLIWFPCM